MSSNYETLHKHSLDVQKIRDEFPILHQEVNGKPLVYFDNAATTQKPLRVIKALTEYYSGYNANIHRGIHTLAEKATSAFEDTRKAVKEFINASEVEEIIFTYGTTDGINLVASTFGRAEINEGDEVIISSMEHHSNIVPWQMLCEEKGAKLKIIPINEKGEIIFEAFEKMLSEKTKLVSIVHVSNSLGTINPVKEVIAKAHEYGAVVLVDGAQASAHIEIDMQDLDCDFYVFSMHKLFGPTGAGILYGKRSLLEAMPPFRGGGEMIKEVTFEKTTYNDIPYKFEAGTPNIADVVAIRKALEFVGEYGKDNIGKYEEELLQYGNERIQTVPGLKLIGTAENKITVISFIIEDIHHFDIGMMMDAMGVALRTGHHCTQPLMDVYKVEGTVRASLSLYNTFEEIDIMVEGLKKIVERLK